MNNVIADACENDIVAYHMKILRETLGMSSPIYTMVTVYLSYKRSYTRIHIY